MLNPHQFWWRSFPKKELCQIPNSLNTETKFLRGLIELQYGQKVERKLRKLAAKIPWARGWPENKKAFWNAEAFMWQRKIGKDTRRCISQELSSLGTGKNLDVGCGSYSYLPSVGFDIADKMLQLNEHCSEKVAGNLEQRLPFSSQSFDSVTAIFVLNYIHHHQRLLREVQRVLKGDGTFVAVLSPTVQAWQRQKEVHSFPPQKWGKLMSRAGFLVKIIVHKELFFFHGRKLASAQIQRVWKARTSPAVFGAALALRGVAAVRRGLL